MNIDSGSLEDMDWLTKEVVQEVLKKDQPNVKVLAFTSEPLPKSYTCKLFRIIVNYLTCQDEQLHTISFIGKRQDNNVTFATDLGMVRKEVMMYKYGLPELEIILEENICPKVYSVTDETIIMEDLSADGYRSIKSGDLLNYNHCVSCIKALAKFHAASVRLYETDPELIKTLGEELFYKDEFYEKFHTVIENGLHSLSEEIALWPESKQFQQPIQNMKNKIWTLLTNLIKHNRLVSVLNHGDFSLNNILFKYDSNEEIYHVKIIDFQCCRFSSPVLDLQSFLSSSVDINVIENHLTNILDIYLETFNSVLLVLKCPSQLSKSDFEIEFKKADFIGLYASSMCLPQYLVDEEERASLKGVNFDEFKNVNTNPILRLMKTQKYRQLMPKILNNFDERGLFIES